MVKKRVNELTNKILAYININIYIYEKNEHDFIFIIMDGQVDYFSVSSFSFFIIFIHTFNKTSILKYALCLSYEVCQLGVMMVK